MACKEGQFDVVVRIANNQFEAFSINSIAQHVNGMTPINGKCTVFGYSRVSLQELDLELLVLLINKPEKDNVTLLVSMLIEPINMYQTSS